jgi:hypothetical protein
VGPSELNMSVIRNANVPNKMSVGDRKRREKKIPWKVMCVKNASSNKNIREK